jgi:hypothetical protein
MDSNAFAGSRLGLDISSLMDSVCNQGLSDKEAAEMCKQFFTERVPTGSARLPFFHAMFGRLLLNKLRPGSVVNKPLSTLTEADGRLIGSTFATCLLTSLSETAAVDEWVERFPPLSELGAEYVPTRANPVRGAHSLTLLRSLALLLPPPPSPPHPPAGTTGSRRS